MAADWIKGAIKRPGRLRRLATAEGKLRKDGTIDPNWLRARAKDKGSLGQAARLALTLRKLR